jgi:hypothetical protein
MTCNCGTLARFVARVGNLLRFTCDECGRRSIRVRFPKEVPDRLEQTIDELFEVLERRGNWGVIYGNH